MRRGALAVAGPPGHLHGVPRAPVVAPGPVVAVPHPEDVSEEVPRDVTSGRSGDQQGEQEDGQHGGPSGSRDVTFRPV